MQDEAGNPPAAAGRAAARDGPAAGGPQLLNEHHFPSRVWRYASEAGEVDLDPAFPPPHTLEPTAVYFDADVHETICKIAPSVFDQVPVTMRLSLCRRRLVDGYVTTDVHPSVWMLVQCHVARGTLTWDDLAADSAFFLLTQAAQPIVTTMSAINIWCLVHKGGVVPPGVERLPGHEPPASAESEADEEDEETYFTATNGFRAGSGLADWLRAVRILEFAAAEDLVARRFPLPASAAPPGTAPAGIVDPERPLPSCGIDPLGLTLPEALRRRAHQFPGDPEVFLHDDAPIHGLELARLAFASEPSREALLHRASRAAAGDEDLERRLRGALASAATADPLLIRKLSALTSAPRPLSSSVGADETALDDPDAPSSDVGSGSAADPACRALPPVRVDCLVTPFELRACLGDECCCTHCFHARNEESMAEEAWERSRLEAGSGAGLQSFEAAHPELITHGLLHRQAVRRLERDVRPWNERMARCQLLGCRAFAAFERRCLAPHAVSSVLSGLLLLRMGPEAFRSTVRAGLDDGSFVPTPRDIPAAPARTAATPSVAPCSRWSASPPPALAAAPRWSASPWSFPAFHALACSKYRADTGGVREAYDHTVLRRQLGLAAVPPGSRRLRVAGMPRGESPHAEADQELPPTGTEPAEGPTDAEPPGASRPRRSRTDYSVGAAAASAASRRGPASPAAGSAQAAVDEACRSLGASSTHIVRPPHRSQQTPLEAIAAATASAVAAAAPEGLSPPDVVESECRYLLAWVGLARRLATRLIVQAAYVREVGKASRVLARKGRRRSHSASRADASRAPRGHRSKPATATSAAEREALEDRAAAVAAMRQPFTR